MLKETKYKDNIKIIHINELEEKAYNHLGVNLHAYKLNLLEQNLEDNKDLEKFENNIISKTYTEEEYKNLKLDVKYKYEEIYFTEDLNKNINIFNNYLNVKNKEKDKDKELKNFFEKTEENIKINNELKKFEYFKLENKNIFINTLDIKSKGEERNILIEIDAKEYLIGKEETKTKIETEKTTKENKINFYRDFKLNVLADGGNINIIYIIKNTNTFSLDNIYLEAKNNGKINFKYVLLGETKGNFKHISKVYKNSKIDVSGIYFLSKKDNLNFMYEGILEEKKAEAKFHLDGIVKDEAVKISKDVLVFKNGARSSVGIEKEDIILLSDDAKIKTAPILISYEEDIIGEHGYASGSLDKNSIFYLESRGISKEDASYLIILAKLKKTILDGIDFEENNELNSNIILQKIEEIEKYIKKDLKKSKEINEFR